MYVCACVFECTGNCLWKQRRSRDALQQFDRALQLEPDEAGHHYSLAAAQFELGQPSSAATGFRRALALSPSYAPGLLGLGHSLRDLHDPSAAAAAYAAAFDILAAARADQEAGWDAHTHATSGPQGYAADECAVGKAAMQAKLLEFSARLAAGDHCNLPADMARACLLAASSSSPLPTLPRASHAFTGGLDEEVVWANMYDVAQLVGPDVIKRLAIARGSALEQHTYGLLLRQAWRPAPHLLPLPTRAHQWLNVVLLSSSLDGDHYVTHAVLNLIAALYAVPAVSAARPRLRMHVISTAKFNAEFALPPSPLAAPARDHGHWGCSLGSAEGGGGGSEWTRGCVMARMALAVEERGGFMVAAHGWSDLEIAKYINAHVNAHILFHLDGYARGAPVQVAAMRPTPVAALWLGYTGTLGMRKSVTHTLVDRVMVPPEYASHMSEKLALLPGRLSALAMRNYTALLQHPPFLPAPCPPRRSSASPTPPTPAECAGSETDNRLCQQMMAGGEGTSSRGGQVRGGGLNRSAVVVANFNSLYKIGPRTVLLWSQALSCPKPAAASSMTPPPAPEKCAPRQLWIAQRPRATAYRLAAALEAHGVAGCATERRPEEREAAAKGVGGAGYFEVITSEMHEAHEHVRVKSCADFFIDSVEVGAHSTAADALAAGLPVVTTAGPAVSQRVAASLLQAGGLLHTLARNPEDTLAVARLLVASKSRIRSLRVTMSRLSRQHLQRGMRNGPRSLDSARAAEGGGQGGDGDGGRELWDAEIWALAFHRLAALLWEAHEACNNASPKDTHDATPKDTHMHIIGAPTLD
jgi:hypothetical protein